MTDEIRKLLFGLNKGVTLEMLSFAAFEKIGEWFRMKRPVVHLSDRRDKASDP